MRTVGLDPSEDIGIAARRRAGVTDPQFESYELYAQALASLFSGDLSAAIEQGERAATITDYFLPLAIPTAARAALWAADAAGARRLIEMPELTRFSGLVLEADRTRVRAGIAALEGRPEALTGFFDALRAYNQLGLPFEEAACAVDLAILIPGVERESPTAAAAIASAPRHAHAAGRGALPRATRPATSRDGDRTEMPPDRAERFAG